jgi:DNA-binding GntR family transcriptional regulator
MSNPKKEALISPLLAVESSIYACILNDIVNAVYVSGDRLVTTTLAKRYNTSINPIREALKQLQGEGFVTVAQNSGARVAKFEYHTLRDVFEILQLLDPYLMEWFVDSHTTEQLDELKQLVQKMESLTPDDYDDYRILDMQFHWLMYNEHYNKNAVELWRKNRLVLHAMHANSVLNYSRISQSIKEHKEMLDSIKNRDAELTINILKQHIQESSKYWSRFIK